MFEESCKICGEKHLTGFCTTSEGKEALKENESFKDRDHEREIVEIRGLGDFDRSFFQKLEGEDGWIAMDDPNLLNQRYFTIFGIKGEKIGIIGIFDTEDEKNITHTVIDSKYRGQSIASKAKLYLMNELKLPFITMTIDLDNTASINATQKLSGVRRVSDKTYEENYHKVKFVYEHLPTDN